MNHLTSEEKQKIEAMDKAIEALLDVVRQGPSIFKNDIDRKCQELIADLGYEIEDMEE